jgi:RsiW-degrading membrane proteinase PrsW (M82 family)
MKIIKPIFFGIIASFGALILEFSLNFFQNDPETGKITFLIAAASLIEESLKFIFIRKIFEESKSDGTENGFLGRALLFGLSFSLLELSFSFSGAPAGQKFSFLIMAAFGIAAIHTMTSGIIGYAMLRAKTLGLAFTAKTLILASLVHLSYNLAIIYFT